MKGLFSGLLPLRLAGILFLLCHCQNPLAAQEHEPGKPVLAELLKSLENYGRGFHGLEFEMTNLAEPDGAWRTGSVVGHSVSRDGQIWAWNSGSEGPSPRTGEKGIAVFINSAGKASLREGWRFNASIRQPRGKPAGEPGMTVTFYEPGASQAVAREPALGFMKGQTFVGFVSESSTEIKGEVVEGERLWLLQCDHPLTGSAEFLFGTSLELSRIHFDQKAGDLVRLGERFSEPEKIPAGMWVRYRYGPIRYAEVAGRRLPEMIPGETVSSLPEALVPVSLRTVFSGYRLLERDLDTRIGFETLGLPADSAHVRVTSQGEEGIRYELRDGRIVKVLDSDALEAASLARVRGEGSGWYWYSAMGAIVLVAAALLVWLRNR